MLPEEQDLTPEQRLRIAFQLASDGIEIMRQNLRRAHPGESEATIERLLGEWLATRRGAEEGDIDSRFAVRRAI